ncbi:hypothetical protein GCM10011414_13320 [Croceivirga lutea]|nr:hypothetical protein GCM10011414_13320 [Croceivirga lutea]
MSGIVFCQNEKMEQLNFMVGEWIGTTKSYENGKVTKEGAAFQRIQYDLEKSILVIELNTEFLLLHTIIYYDAKDETYYYYPFSKNGVSRYPASFIDGKLVVQPNDARRFTFSQTTDGGFREHGEQLVDGEWITYFEDTFTNSK